MDEAKTETPTNNGNNGNLPPARQAAFENGLHEFQRLGAERDDLARECARLKTDLAGSRVVAEALQSQLTEAESRVASAYIAKDEAVARRAELETILGSIMSILRAFQIQNEPLIKPVDSEDKAKYELPYIGGA